MADNPIGRPTKMTPETFSKLDEAFALGCSDLEACLLADISPALLYSYQKDNPEFLERKNKLKETPILLARTSVIKGMQDSPELALKFLERRKKDEFSLKTENEVYGKGGLPLGITPQEVQLLKEVGITVKENDNGKED